MRDGKALTNMEEFGGKPYKAGDRIPGSVLDKISPRALKALVDNYKIEIEGMEPSSGAGTGGQAHLAARCDALADQNKTLIAGFKALTDRVIVLEGGKPAAAPKNPAPTGRRAARAAAPKE